MYVPGATDVVAETVSIEVDEPKAGRRTFGGLKVIVGPAGETVAESVMLPVKPPILVAVMMEELLDPWATLMVAGFAEREKSAVTVSAANAVWDRLPVVPVMVTL